MRLNAIASPTIPTLGPAASVAHENHQITGRVDRSVVLLESALDASTELAKFPQYATTEVLEHASYDAAEAARLLDTFGTRGRAAAVHARVASDQFRDAMGDVVPGDERVPADGALRAKALEARDTVLDAFTSLGLPPRSD